MDYLLWFFFVLAVGIGFAMGAYWQYREQQRKQLDDLKRRLEDLEKKQWTLN